VVEWAELLLIIVVVFAVVSWGRRLEHRSNRGRVSVT